MVKVHYWSLNFNSWVILILKILSDQVIVLVTNKIDEIILVSMVWYFYPLDTQFYNCWDDLFVMVGT